jgi:hypothetical protein
VFRRPTVFVLGAGSSNEANLPVGAELRTAIAELLSTTEEDLEDVRIDDSEILAGVENACREAHGNLNDYVAAAQSMSAAMPLALSIDNYLEAHQDDQRKTVVGKLAITKAILDAEADSLLSSQTEWDDDIDFSSVSNTWFVKFMQAATEGVTTADLPNIFRDVSVINFNYDRCVEHFVRHALQVYYDLDDANAEQIANSLYVFHPFGSVGQLPWQQSGTGVSFGSRKRGHRLLRIARSIKTFSERVDEGTELHQMRVRVANAEQLIFLGFAFHRQNLELLSPGYPAEPKHVYATTINISKSDQALLKGVIPEYLGLSSNDVPIHMVGSKCSEIIDEYWRTFTAYA